MSKNDKAASILRKLQNDPAHIAKFGCMYGVHPFEEDVPSWGYKTCPNCGACYIMPKLYEHMANYEPTQEESDKARRDIEKILLDFVDEDFAECNIVNGIRHYSMRENNDRESIRSHEEDGRSSGINVARFAKGRGCIEGI